MTKPFQDMFFVKAETFRNSFELQCLCKLLLLSEFFMSIFQIASQAVQLLETTHLTEGFKTCSHFSLGRKIELVFVD